MPGGVCAVLDYEVELMAEYVAEMTTRLAMGTSKPPEPFRKFISQILSSTRLPRTTIMLGMNYLAKRINIMNLSNPGKQLTLSEGHVWRLLTVALLLGSKFLDDNTFQNRSWADVSGIPVRELNKLEREWMEAINWCLYVNLDRSEDYTAWINSWRDWEAGKKRMLKLAAMPDPLEAEYNPTRVSRRSSVATTATASAGYNTWHKKQIAEYERLSKASKVHRTEPSSQVDQSIRLHARMHDPAVWGYQSSASDPWSATPLTPPDSGYGTPENADSAAAMNTRYDEWPHHTSRDSCRTTVSNSSYGSASKNRQPAAPPYPVTANLTPYSDRCFPATKFNAYSLYGHNIWDNSADGAASGMGCAPHSHMGKPSSYFGVANSFTQAAMA